jgi:hypothetical protein
MNISQKWILPIRSSSFLPVIFGHQKQKPLIRRQTAVARAAVTATVV